MNPEHERAPGRGAGGREDQVGTGSSPSLPSTGDIPADLTRPYEAAWRAYWDAGWRGVLSLPPRRKIPPPDGFTGRAGIDPSFADCTTWADDSSPHNIGLRLPATHIGIDKDCWDGKTGDQSIAAKEAEWGPLPKTWRSTSRGFDTGNGIWLYRVPEGTVLTEQPLDDVEIIQRHHRYVVCWPSIHPNGGRYEWLDERTGQTGGVPHLDDLPELPAAWIDGLRGEAKTYEKATVNGEDVAALIDAMPDGDACDHVRRAAAKVFDADGRHDGYRDAMLAVVGAGRQGCPGAAAKLKRMRRTFLADVTAPDQDKAHRRTVAKAAAEWAEMLHGALEIVVADQPHQGSHCIDVPAWITEGDDGDTDRSSTDEAQPQWRMPQRLSEGCPQPFPLHTLPEAMALAVEEVAKAVMADPALPANAFLGAAAGLLGPITTVVIDGTWQTRCNAYFVSIAETGEVKSPSMTPALAPLQLVEDALRGDAEQDKITAEAMLPIVVNELKAMQKAEKYDQATVVKLQEQVREYQKTLRRDVCLLVDDTTPERLAELLADNDGSLTAWNDEGSLLSHLLGLYAASPNLDVWLKGWGGENLTIERKGGGGREKTSLRVREPRLTVVAAIQPVTIRRIGADKRHRHLIERGVIARALFSWPPSTAGTRMLQGRERNPDQDYQHVGPWSLHLIENHRQGEMVLAMSSEAREYFYAWHDQIEEGLPMGGTYSEVRAFAVKYRDNAARLAGLFARLDNYRLVQQDHIEAATDLIDYYLANAVTVVEAWAEDALGLAINLLAKLRRREPTASLKVRELYRDVVRTRHSDVLAALEVLDHAGWVKPLNARTGYGAAGREIGKESPVVLLNPAIWGG